MLEDVNVVWLGSIASLLAGLGTGVGALGVFLVRKLTPQLQDGMLSAAAGVMLAASFFSLLLPGIEYGEELTDATWSAALMVIAGLLMGAALHNFPEGMAVGVGFAGGDIGNGVALAVGIGLQNIPEGLAVAVSLLAIEHSRLKSFGIAVLTGLLEPVGGLFGSTMVWLAEPIMPWTLGFAAGAMLFIISDEIIPETHRGRFKTLATFSLLGGFVIMMFLDATLG